MKLVALSTVLGLLLARASPAQTDLGPTQDELNRAAGNTADWLHAGHDYSGLRYTPLKQITARNAHQLRPVCAYQAASSAAFHTNPLVYRGVMFLTTRHETLALDARTCRLRWKQDHYPERKSRVQANRGVAIKDGKILRGTADGRLISMDAATGSIVWERKHADQDKGESFNMPPVIFEDVVIIGAAGSENGLKGWIGGFRFTNGEPLWRFDVVPNPGDAAAATWGDGAALNHGGGGVWTPIVVDAERGHVFIGTGDPAPALDGSTRPGDNLYTNSLLVLNARDGKPIWHKQLIPHDLYDRGITAGPVFSTSLKGNSRPVIAASGKDGLIRVMDRETRELVFERAVSEQLNADIPPSPEGTRVCPGITGGVLWNGPAFNPLTNLLYVPSVEWCTTFTLGGDPKAWFTRYFGGIVTWDPVSESRGRLTAVDASTGEVRWRYDSDAPMVGAVTTTASKVLFTGEVSGDFLALDAQTGKVLYRFNTGGAVAGGVISYMIAGKQHVAVMSGGMTGFWQRPGGSATVFVFALP